MVLLILLLQFIIVWSCPPQNPSGGDPPLQPSVDFPGGDIDKIPTPDETSCQLACTNHPHCSFFSYHSIDPSTGERSFDCHLKNSTTDTPPSSEPVPGVTSGYTLPKTPENVNRCLSQYYNDVEFIGNVLSFGNVSSREDCEASCTRNPGCQFYTYYPPTAPSDLGSQQRCYLQYSTSLPSPPNITLTDGAQSGFSQKDCCTGTECLNGCADLIFPDTSFSGTIIAQERSFDVIKCQEQCTLNPLCQFFTYYLHEDLWCVCNLLRTESGLPENVTSIHNAFSGFGKQATEPGFLGCADLLSQDVEYEGITVLDTEVENVEQCQQICTSDTLCQFFTVLPGDSSMAHGISICRLKNAAANIPTTVTPLKDVVSGFALQYNTVQKNIQNCTFLLYPNLAFSGVVLKQISAVDAESCRSSCTENPECSHFSFSWDGTENSFICTMQAASSGNPIDVYSAPSVTSGFSLDVGGSLDCSSLLLPNTTFSGSLIGYMMAPDAYQCQRLCTQNPPCQFFTHLGADWHMDEHRFYCFLQSGDQPNNIIHLPNSTSGFSKPLSGIYRECILDEYDGLNFPGADERSLKATSFKDCQSMCTKDPLCQFFTFFTEPNILPDQTDTCYLKSLLSIPLPQIIKSAPGVVSGFAQKNCKGTTSDSPPSVLPSC